MSILVTGNRIVNNLNPKTVNTFNNICMTVDIALFVLAMICTLAILLEKPARYLLASLLVLVFAFSSCNVPWQGKPATCDDTGNSKHDTGTYFIYRAYNLHTGIIQEVKVDTVFDVYNSTDTVYVDHQGFISPTKENITDIVVLGICKGTVTLLDDGLIIRSSRIVPKHDLGTAD